MSRNSQWVSKLGWPGGGEEDTWGGGGGVKARNKVKFQPKVHLFRGKVGRRVSKTVNRREKNLGF